MYGAVLHSPGDVRFEARDAPKIIKSTDAVIRIAAIEITSRSDTFKR